MADARVNRPDVGSAPQEPKPSPDTQHPHLPESLTIRILDGGSVASSYESSTVVTVSLVYPLNRFEELVAFYRSVLIGWNRLENGGPNGSSVQFHSGADSVNVGVCVDMESAGVDIDAACVSITQQQ